MAGWRERIGRMGNHYANEAGLNHTVPMIICREEPRLLGSLVCSTAGTLFFCFLFHSSSIVQFSHLFSLPSLLACMFWTGGHGCVCCMYTLALTHSVHIFKIVDNDSLAI